MLVLEAGQSHTSHGEDSDQGSGGQHHSPPSAISLGHLFYTSDFSFAEWGDQNRKYEGIFSTVPWLESKEAPESIFKSPQGSQILIRAWNVARLCWACAKEDMRAGANSRSWKFRMDSGSMSQDWWGRRDCQWGWSRRWRVATSHVCLHEAESQG